jgi:hypothetical protein
MRQFRMRWYDIVHDFCLDGCVEWYELVQDYVWLIVWVHLRFSFVRHICINSVYISTNQHLSELAAVVAVLQVANSRFMVFFILCE